MAHAGPARPRLTELEDRYTPSDTTPPTAELASAPAVTRADLGATSYDFTVTFADDVAVDVATLGGAVRVYRLDGVFIQTPALVGVDPAGSGNPRTATYRLVPPGGSWDPTDGGPAQYYIATEEGRAKDTSGNAVARKTLGPLSVFLEDSSSLVGYPQFAVGADRGGDGTVTVYNRDQSVLARVQPFGAFDGGVRVAVGDFNADGVTDLAAGTGPGRPTRVVVLDGKDRHELFAADPFEATFTGGLYVAAGDLDGDGYSDLVVTPDEGGGPRVRVFGGNGFPVVADFFGIDDPDFRGGARAAVADVAVDSKSAGDLIVAAGFGGGPRVAGYYGPSLVAGKSVRIFDDFFAFEQTLRNGVFVAAGDIDRDWVADLVFGGGPGGGPRVTVLDGWDIRDGKQTVLANFFGGNQDGRGGIRVAVKDLDGDSRADIVTGAGTGAGSRVAGYLGKTLSPAGVPAAALDFDAFAGFGGGVYVG